MNVGKIKSMDVIWALDAIFLFVHPLIYVLIYSYGLCVEKEKFHYISYANYIKLKNINFW